MHKKTGVQKTLVGNQRYLLFKFCEKHPTANETYEDLAMMATVELGFTVTKACLEHHWISVHGKRNHRVSKNAASLESRIMQLEMVLKSVLAEKGTK